MNEMRLNGNHDIFVENGRFSRILKVADENRAYSFCESVKQKVLVMLKTEQGEAFTDYEYGVPWFSRILDLPVNYLDLAVKILKEKISKIEGVREVLSLKLRVEGRNMGGTVRIRTTNGEIAQGDF